MARRRRGLRRGAPPRAARGATRAAGHGRALRPVLQGVHAGDGQGGARRAPARPCRAATSPSGSSDDVTHRSLPHDPHLRHRAGRRRARRVLRPRLGRHGRLEQEHHQDHRRGDRPLRPGLLRLRLAQVGLDDGLAPALRAAPHPLDLPGARGELHRLPPPAVPGSLRRRRDGEARRDAAAQRSVEAGGGLGSPARRGAGAAPREAHPPRGHRRPGRGGGGRPRGRRSGPSCRRASSRSRRSCRTSEALDQIKKAIAKTYGKRGEVVVKRNYAAVDLAVLRMVEVPLPGAGHRDAAPRASPWPTSGDRAPRLRARP